MSTIKFENIFTDQLPGDASHVNVPRQVKGACYSFVKPKGMAAPKMILYNQELAKALNISDAFCRSKEFLDIMAGNSIAPNSHPYAMCYGGHQFGHWAGQLGDGRAINLGEVLVKDGFQTLQLKGAGPTPYSRTADGLAVLRSSIREFLCSEAMYALGVPTTRALSLLLTGEEVLRDVMYDGHAAYEKGAVICRTAPSFIRFGSFEILASQGDTASLHKLADYTIEHHYPHLKDVKNKYLELFRVVADKTCEMIVHWQRVGFVHGVMNTDNMSIIGLTIDYGPYGWIDNFDPDWTPNTTDLPGRRYRFGNQPIVAQWNLTKLASALYLLIGKEHEEALKNIIVDFQTQYLSRYQAMMASKLGFDHFQNGDEKIIGDLNHILQTCNLDMTIFFRTLADIKSDTDIHQAVHRLTPAMYNEDMTDHEKAILSNWIGRYTERLQSISWSDTERVKQMNSVNPRYVLRNYMAQLAIESADNGDYALLNEIYEMLKHPYDEQPEYDRWYARRPDWAVNKVGSSMLSCSS